MPNIAPKVEARMLPKLFISRIVVSLGLAVFAPKIVVPKVLECNNT